jgi:hypothetical protein
MVGIAVLCSALGAADKPAPTPFEQINQDLLHIQNHVANAGMRLRHPVVSINVKPSDRPATPGPGAGSAGTPARTCCQNNIDAVLQKVRVLNEQFDRLDVQKTGERRAEALTYLEMMRTRLDMVAQGMAAFATAESTGRANEALQGIIRPFNELRRAKDALEQCFPGASQP